LVGLEEGSPAWREQWMPGPADPAASLTNLSLAAAIALAGTAALAQGNPAGAPALFSKLGRKTLRHFIARPLPSQADDIRAHRQQNGDAYSDNDQEEFSHGSASLGPQRKAAGIVLGWRAKRTCVEEGPPSRRALRRSRRDRDQIAMP
jgi:hypothetical protein